MKTIRIEGVSTGRYFEMRVEDDFSFEITKEYTDEDPRAIFTLHALGEVSVHPLPGWENITHTDSDGYQLGEYRKIEE
ncbi:hypothetical protein PBI_GRAYSON_177 [Rhodococcus phage Grayson]|nr:hypothetical protein PBI_GRAYSON_177 [Rhodococcus phage Grayson]